MVATKLVRGNDRIGLEKSWFAEPLDSATPPKARVTEGARPTDVVSQTQPSHLEGRGRLRRMGLSEICMLRATPVV
jgi:hypothetical protein